MAFEITYPTRHTDAFAATGFVHAGVLLALTEMAYAAFEEAVEAGGGSLLDETGKRFHREILAVGGSRPALESFKAFRGREPKIDALLRHNGMQA